MTWHGWGMLWHDMVGIWYVIMVVMVWHGTASHGRGMVWHGNDMVWHDMVGVLYGMA